MTAATTSPKHYTWTFPGAPLRVRVNLDTVSNLQHRLTASREGKGILLGRVDGNAIEIASILEAPESIAASLGNLHLAEDLSVVGFYRTTTDSVLRLNPSDVELATAHFANPSQVVLLLQVSETGPGDATFFFWDEGRLHADFPFLEFPWDAEALANKETQRQWRQANVREVRAAAVEAEAKPESAPGKPARRPLDWRLKAASWIAIALIPLIAAGARLYRSYTSTSAKALSPAIKLVDDAPNLGLKFQRQGTDLAVTWDREAATRVGATMGLLSIRDGAKERAIGLSAEQLRSANILVAPESDQVQLQLTLVMPDQKTISQSGIALLNARGKPEELIRIVPVASRPVTAQQVQQEAQQVQPEAVKPSATRAFVPPPAAPPSAQRTASIPAIGDPPPTPVGGAAVRSVATPSLLADALPKPTLPTGSVPVPGAASGESSAPTGTTVKPAEYLSGRKPAYPPNAFNGNIQGTVTVDAIVGEDGRVKRVTRVSGHPLLQDAATSAVRTWIFRPATLNGKPVEAPVEVDVKFHRP